MLVHRSRLLLLLVLIPVVVAATWTIALAGGSTGHPTVASSSLGASKPGAAPTSGEPDVGTTPRPALPAGWHVPGPRAGDAWMPGHLTSPWFRWIFRIWTVRYLGAR
jgi:hypothetical protein